MGVVKLPLPAVYRVGYPYTTGQGASFHFGLPFAPYYLEPTHTDMKALGILLVSATLLLAGCACDCKDKMGDNAFEIDSVNGTAGTNGDHTTGNSGTKTGTVDGTDRGNTSTTGNDNTSAANTTDKTKTPDPRTYGTTSGGIGYRTDTIDEYKGENGSARDKTPK